jgi:hypothetical protein
MQNFRQRTPLENGLSWTAEYKGHDWARHFSFYFLITLYQGAAVLRQFPVEVYDCKYGDPTCEYSDEQLAEKLRAALGDLALKGEPNTGAIL